MYPTAYIQFLIHFHGDYDYFECHEVLEEYWKLKPRGERDNYWVGFIQIAVSLYHHRRLNWNGSMRMMKSAIAILQKEKKQVHKLGLDQQKLLTILQKQLQSIQRKEPFTPIFLPFSDPSLENTCLQLCTEKMIPWKDLHSFPTDYIVHKHKLRDRRDVIVERNEQLQKRKQR
ncbi:MULTISPECIES: DUF309 domain-containing protein [Bacillus cereus group]|uniref:DUF309 domain-containing protein n=1 Tax=Bacillus cereus TaxID=1396 RepID=A0AA44Q9R3_BACCE|nr:MULTISPECIES: DUF309 domain-containing protein [Bacillus cereus group]PFA24153.1 DUF309 domain-containing protein [Bacillus cereus]PFN09591.1 DUF309 domain-containing protein [Bacillus cereus]PFO81499.1 DUF309 domain-containing protein [Bacillus cereus]PFR25416.1 DUF309 domain-containing protein [Bacillus cereus]PFR99782.1 DUF309 domain-containing protein [Bacillus cereus]